MNTDSIREKAPGPGTIAKDADRISFCEKYRAECSARCFLCILIAASAYIWHCEVNSMTEKELIEASAHCLSMENRRKMSLTGVTDVSGFNDNTVLLKTTLGALAIQGEQLHIGRIDLDLGLLELEGTISELSYSDASPVSGFWQRLFG